MKIRTKKKLGMKVFAFIMATLMLASVIVPSVMASEPIKVKVDSKEIAMKVSPVNKNGRIMVDPKPIADAMGWTIEYEYIDPTILEGEKFNQYKGTKNFDNIMISIVGHELLSKTTDTFSMPLSEYSLYISATRKNTNNYILSAGENKFSEMENVDCIVNDNAFLVPVASLAKGMYSDVNWNGDTQTVSITTGRLPMYEPEEIPHFDWWLNVNSNLDLYVKKNTKYKLKDKAIYTLDENMAQKKISSVAKTQEKITQEKPTPTPKAETKEVAKVDTAIGKLRPEYDGVQKYFLDMAMEQTNNKYNREDLIVLVGDERHVEVGEKYNNEILLPKTVNGTTLYYKDVFDTGTILDNKPTNILVKRAIVLKEVEYKPITSVPKVGSSPAKVLINEKIGAYNSDGSLNRNNITEPYKKLISVFGGCNWYAYGRLVEVTGLDTSHNNFTGGKTSSDWLANVDKNTGMQVKTVYDLKKITAPSIAVYDGHVKFIEYVERDSNDNPTYIYYTDANYGHDESFLVGRDGLVIKESFTNFLNRKSGADGNGKLLGYITLK